MLRMAPQLSALSWQQRQGFELLTGGAEASEMIDRRAGRGERERLERFGEHPVQIGFGADTIVTCGLNFSAMLYLTYRDTTCRF
jgi:hypothetical protein